MESVDLDTDGAGNRSWPCTECVKKGIDVC